MKYVVIYGGCMAAEPRRYDTRLFEHVKIIEFGVHCRLVDGDPVVDAKALTISDLCVTDGSVLRTFFRHKLSNGQ